MKVTIALVEQNLKTTVHNLDLKPVPSNLKALFNAIQKELHFTSKKIRLFVNGTEYIDEMPELKSNCTLVIYAEQDKARNTNELENKYAKEILDSGFFNTDRSMKDTELIAYLDKKELIREDLIENYDDYRSEMIDFLFNRDTK